MTEKEQIEMLKGAMKELLLADIEREEALETINYAMNEDVSSIIKDEVLFRHHTREEIEDPETIEEALASIGILCDED